MDVSENSGFSPQIIHFNRVFHYKPSNNGGTPIFGNTQIGKVGVFHHVDLRKLIVFFLSSVSLDLPFCSCPKVWCLLVPLVGHRWAVAQYSGCLSCFFSFFWGFKGIQRYILGNPSAFTPRSHEKSHEKSLCVKSLPRHQVNYNGFEAEKKKKIEKTEATIDPSELGLAAWILNPPWWVAMGGGFFLGGAFGLGKKSGTPNLSDWLLRKGPNEDKLIDGNLCFHWHLTGSGCHKLIVCQAAIWQKISRNGIRCNFKNHPCQEIHIWVLDKTCDAAMQVMIGIFQC